MVAQAFKVTLSMALALGLAAGAFTPPVANAAEPVAKKAGKKTKPADEGATEQKPGASTQPVSWYVWCEGTPDEGPAPLTVKLEADPIEDIPSPKYTWDFGDGSDGAKGQKVSHTYKKPGLYTARCQVTDPSGGTGDDTVQIEVTAAGAKKDAPSKKK